MNRPIKVHEFVFNPKDNGGEQLRLVTSIYDNGDAFAAGHSARGRSPEAALKGGLYLIHEFTLQSYGNSATINFGANSITPAALRKLADELEHAIYAADSEVVHAGIVAAEKKQSAA